MSIGTASAGMADGTVPLTDQAGGLRRDDGTQGPSAADAAPAGLAKAWWMVAVLFTLYLFSWLDRLIISMLVTPIKADLALSDAQLGVILGPSFGIAYAVCSLPLGWAADNFPRKFIIFGGALTWSVATMACGLSQSFEALLIARIFVGVGEAALLPAAYSLIGDGFPRNRLTLATAVFQTASKFGAATAFGVGAIIIALITTDIDIPYLGLLQPWQTVMVLVGLPVLAIAFLVFTFPEPRRSAAPQESKSLSSRLLRNFLRENATLCALVISGFTAISIGGFAMIAWLPTYIEREFGLGPQQYGFQFSLMNLIAAAALVLNGKLADILFARGMEDVHIRLPSWQAAAIIPVIFLMFSTSNVYLLLACYCLFQFVVTPLTIYVSALAVIIAPREIRAQLLALYLFIITVVGSGVGASLIGLLTDYVFRDEGSLGTALALVCGTNVVLAFAALRMSLRHVRPLSGPPPADG